MCSSDFIDLVNDKSIEFIDRWLCRCKLVDIVINETDNDFVYVLYRWEGSDIISVVSLARKDSSCEPTFFGRLSHLVEYLAYDSVPDGYKKRFGNEVYAKIREIEKEYIRKYSLPANYFWIKDH